MRSRTPVGVCVVAVLVTAAVLGGVRGGTGPAAAHETASSLVPVIDGFTSGAEEVVGLEGVEASVQASQDATLLALVVERGILVEVLDEDGEPWARVTATTVEVDVTSPAFHAATNAAGAVPARLPAPAEPWTEVSRDGRLMWFEHRLHPNPAALDVDPAVLASDQAQDVASWSVPLRIDGVEVALEGRLRHVPVTGRLEPRLRSDRELAPGVVVEVVPGAVPGFFLRNDSDQPVTVVSRDGSPYVVLDSRGARVNTASATWAEQPQARLLATDGAADDPVFEQVSATPSHTWLDARAALPGVLPPDHVRASQREVTVREWSIPVQVGDDLVAVEGELVWVPLAAAGTASAADESRTPLPPLEFAVAGVVGAALLVLWVRRHRLDPQRSQVDPPPAD